METSSLFKNTQQILLLSALLDNKYTHFLYDISASAYCSLTLQGIYSKEKKQEHAANELMQFVICSLIPYGMMGRMCNLCLPKKCPCLCCCCCCCKTTRTRGHGYGTLTKIRHHFVLGVRNLARGVARGESAFAFLFQRCLLSSGSEARNALKLSPRHILAFS